MAKDPSEDYIKIRKQCIKTGRPWQDPDFPANDSSLFFSEPPCQFVWRRPSEICAELGLKPELFVGGADRFDLQQGCAGNCWVISGASALAERPAILNKVIAPGQTVFNKDKNYCGILRFYFWRYGDWEEVLVDDQLPWVNGMDHLAFVHSKQPNEFWGALLEKAYAKLHGSYESLTGGSVSDSLTDFTGGICESYDIQDHQDDEKRERLWKILFQSNSRRAVIGAGINKPDDEPEPAEGESYEGILENGLVTGHAYSVTDVKELNDFRIGKKKPTRVRLVRVRNPWGNDIEWNGDWGDSSDMWNHLSPEQTQYLLGFGNDVEAPDGEFFMPYEDFVANFHNIDICNMDPKEMGGGKDANAWSVAVYHGSWVAGFNAGGRAACKETHWTNPQYEIEVEDADDDDDTGTLIVQLLQKDKRKIRHQMHQVMDIGFFIYKKLDGFDFPMPKEFFSAHGAWKKKGKNSGGTAAKCQYFAPKRQNVCRFELDPGSYVVIPCCYDPDEEAEFMLRIFSEKECGKPEPDTETMRLEDVELPLAPVNPNDSKSFKAYFQQMAGEDMSMDAFELVEAVNTLLKTDKNFNPFTVDACRQMVSLFDADASGKLDIDEFHHVVQHIRAYQTIFQTYDTDGSGTMSTYELRPAIKALGFQLSDKIQKSLIFQYADEENEISQDAFIIMAIKLKMLFDAFEDNHMEGLLTLNLGGFVSICSKIEARDPNNPRPKPIPKPKPKEDKKKEEEKPKPKENKAKEKEKPEEDKAEDKNEEKPKETKSKKSKSSESDPEKTDVKEKRKLPSESEADGEEDTKRKKQQLLQSAPAIGKSKTPAATKPNQDKNNNEDPVPVKPNQDKNNNQGKEEPINKRKNAKNKADPMPEDKGKENKDNDEENKKNKKNKKAVRIEEPEAKQSARQKAMKKAEEDKEKDKDNDKNGNKKGKKGPPQAVIPSTPNEPICVDLDEFFR